MGDEVIRRAKEEDLPELVLLCKEHATYEQVEYEMEGKSALLSQSLFQSNNGIIILVVEAKGCLIGYATILKQFSTWEADYYYYMDCLYLKEDARGKGLGTRMMREIINCAVRSNYNLQWQTPIFNTNAIGFYKTLGARDISKVRFFWNVHNIEEVQA